MNLKNITGTIYYWRCNLPLMAYYITFQHIQPIESMRKKSRHLTSKRAKIKDGCLFLCVCGRGTHLRCMCIWRSEENSQDSRLSSTMWVPGIEFRLSSLALTNIPIYIIHTIKMTRWHWASRHQMTTHLF